VTSKRELGDFATISARLGSEPAAETPAMIAIGESPPAPCVIARFEVAWDLTRNLPDFRVDTRSDPTLSPEAQAAALALFTNLNRFHTLLLTVFDPSELQVIDAMLRAREKLASAAVRS
jgi:hypothetical protein